MALEMGAPRAHARVRHARAAPSDKSTCGAVNVDELNYDAALAAIADAIYEEGETCAERMQDLGLEQLTVGEQGKGAYRTIHFVAAVNTWPTTNLLFPFTAALLPCRVALQDF